MLRVVSCRVIFRPVVIYMNNNIVVQSVFRKIMRLRGKKNDYNRLESVFFFYMFFTIAMIAFTMQTLNWQRYTMPIITTSTKPPVYSMGQPMARSYLFWYLFKKYLIKSVSADDTYALIHFRGKKFDLYFINLYHLSQSRVSIRT